MPFASLMSKKMRYPFQKCLVKRQQDPKTPEIIDINSATVKDFQKLPGIGPSIAQRIVDYRTQKGKFNAIDDMTQVNGIGPKTLERLRTQLTINQP
jgi:competence protein ComEA